MILGISSDSLLLVVLGCVIAVAACFVYQKLRLRSIKVLGDAIIKAAEQDALTIRKTAEFAAQQIHLEKQREMEQHWQLEKRKLAKEEDRLKQREDKIEGRVNFLEKKLAEVERREEAVASQIHKIDEKKMELLQHEAKILAELENLSGLNAGEAKKLLLSQLSDDVKKESATLIRRTRAELEEAAEMEASRIITTAINRLASTVVCEGTVNTVPLPNDEMKGRIIGREGRNIRALEQATGVNIMIDDTPGAIVLSCFDPVRLHIAKSSLQELLKDGRIHPSRIEETVEKAKSEIQKQIKRSGEDAAFKAGCLNLHPEIMILLGKLNFRYSYGQNILEHSLEVSHLMGLMAAELGLDVQRAKRIGLLHDMGKAVSHEMEGSHAIVGHDLALRYGELPQVANGIGCHHNEMPATTPEGSLCSAADAISASRPGARVEAIEHYIKRVKTLEEMAQEQPGVDKAYALQAGRELRVIVLPDAIDDDGTLLLARNLTKRIEQELRYPGKIKVTVIREKRSVDYAL